MTDQPTPLPEPLRAGDCELCGKPARFLGLYPLELETAELDEHGLRRRRVLYVCGRHDHDGAAPAPRDTTLAGTSRTRPQTETLFDPEDRCAAGCRYPDLCPPCIAGGAQREAT